MNSICFRNQLSTFGCWFWIFLGFLFGKNMFFGVFEGVENDFTNNLELGTSFKNFRPEPAISRQLFRETLGRG